MTNAHVLIVGGAGFIGCNLASHLAGQGQRVRIYDDLSRGGTDENLAWLHGRYGDKVEAVVGDVRDGHKLRRAVEGAQAVFHFAAQVAMTTSVSDPRHDFDVNVRGTIELLEAIRTSVERPPLVFTSTNKVYGCLPSLDLTVDGDRWTPVDPVLRARGIAETQPLDFRTPYGCSKGAADQYVLDYAHTFGLASTVFRMSCIYGRHQHGTEDQGWIAHILMRAIAGEPITIYGDGRQVRDVLNVEDLVDALVRAWTRIRALSGHAFNIGGGPGQTLSLLELLRMIEDLRGQRLASRHAPWRLGDQRYYVSDTTAFRDATGWRPRITPRAGVDALHGWLVERQARLGSVGKEVCP